MPLAVTCQPYFGAQGTGAFKFVKDLVLEVPRFPLTCRDALFSASSPVAGAALLGLSVLDARFFRRIQYLVPRPQATSMPFADEVSYTKRKYECATPRTIFLYNFGPECHRASINTGDFS